MRILAWLLFVLGIAHPVMAEPVSDLEQILAADRAFDEATAREGVQGWLSYFAPQGVMHLSNGTSVSGHDAISALMAPAFEDPAYSLRWIPTNGAMIIPNVIGYTTGSFEQRHSDDAGKTVVTRGTYVSVWKKQDDGTWKVILDTGSSPGQPQILEE